MHRGYKFYLEDILEIDYEILWDIIKHKLPELQKGIKAILEKEQ